MADSNPPAAGDDGILASADAAAERMASAQRSGQAGASDTITESNNIAPERESALDKAFREAAQNEPTPGSDTEESVGRTNKGVKVPIEGEPTPEELAAAERKSVETQKKAAEPDPANKSETTDRKPDADDPKKAYDDIKLRSDASPKTQETFDAVKNRAAERETQVRTQLAEVQTKLNDYEAKIADFEKRAGQPTEETAAELKELREFRALHDVGSRPEFKQKFDGRIDTNNKTIYSLFKEKAMSDSVIGKLQALSEDARAAYIEKNVFPHLTPSERRLVEAKLFDNVTAQDERRQALEVAKADADKIIAEQRTAPQKTAQERTNAIIGILSPIVNKMPYLQLAEIPPTASEAEKKELQAHNEFATALQEDLKFAIVDDSPKTRAEAALAIPIARYYSTQYKTVLARAEAAEAKLAKITAASATGRRLGQSTSSQPSSAPVAKTTDDSSDAVDNLFKSALASAPAGLR